MTTLSQKILIAALSVLALTAVAYGLMFHAFPPTGLDAAGVAWVQPTTVQTLQCVLVGSLDRLNVHTEIWSKCLHFEQRYGLWAAFELRQRVVFYLLVCSVVLMVSAYFSQDSSYAPRVVRGRRKLVGSTAIKALKSASKRNLKKSSPAVELVDGVWLSFAQLCEHLIIVGRSGGGKTQFIKRIIKSLLSTNRDAFIVTLDLKSNLVGTVPGGAEMPDGSRAHPILLSTADARGHQWIIGADIQDPSAIAGLAEKLCPASTQEPSFWCQASRSIVYVASTHLHRTKPGQWTFSDLANECSKPIEQLAVMAKEQGNSMASKLLRNALGETGANIEASVAAYLAPLNAISNAWSKETKMFSFRGWMAMENPNRQVLILGSSGLSEDIDKIWMATFLGSMLDFVASSEFQPRPHQILSLLLDELCALPRVPVAKALELGREKQVSIVVGVQSLGQIDHTYRSGTSDNWLANFGAQIFVGQNPGPSTLRLEQIVGSQDVIEYEPVPNSQAAGNGSAPRQPRRRSQPVMTEAEMCNELGPTKSGVRALMLGLSEDACITTLPYTSDQALRIPFVKRKIQHDGTLECDGANTEHTSNGAAPRPTIAQKLRDRLEIRDKPPTDDR